MRPMHGSEARLLVSGLPLQEQEQLRRMDPDAAANLLHACWQESQRKRLVKIYLAIMALGAALTAAVAWWFK